MKRFWIGVAVMAALLAAGFCITTVMTCICSPISRQLEQAAQTDVWEQAVALAGEASQSWQHHRKLCAAVTDHEPMEQIDSLFGTLDIYIRLDERTHFRETCAQLASLTEAMLDAQAIAWWHIF